MKVTAIYLQFQSAEELAIHKMPSVVYRSRAEDFRGLLSDGSWRKPCKKKIIAFKCKYLMSDCEAKLDTEMENRGIWLAQAEKLA